jgi:hypothetical protein
VCVIDTLLTFIMSQLFSGKDNPPVLGAFPNKTTMFAMTIGKH